MGCAVSTSENIRNQDSSTNPIVPINKIFPVHQPELNATPKPNQEVASIFKSDSEFPQASPHNFTTFNAHVQNTVFNIAPNTPKFLLDERRSCPKSSENTLLPKSTENQSQMNVISPQIDLGIIPGENPFLPQSLQGSLIIPEPIRTKNFAL